MKSRPKHSAATAAATAAAVLMALESRVLLAATPPSLWTTQGPGGGGSYFSANLNGNDLWVASDMSGIYHSPDLGATWQMQNFHSAGGGINGGTAPPGGLPSHPHTPAIPPPRPNVPQ